MSFESLEEGKMQSGLLRKAYFRKELKGKSPDEQAIIKYLDLLEDWLSFERFRKVQIQMVRKGRKTI